MVLVGAAPLLRAQDETEEIAFDEAEVFFEFNSTNLDLGFQLFFEGPGWRDVRVTGPEGTVFAVETGGGLREVGSTEVSTKSVEPELDERNLAEAILDFVDLFPEGEYLFEGTTVTGEDLAETAELTHDLPTPVFLFVENFPDIDWLPDEDGPAIVGYEVVVEIIVEVNEDGTFDQEVDEEEGTFDSSFGGVVFGGEPFAGGTVADETRADRFPFRDELSEERVFVNTATFPGSQTSFTVSDQFAALVADFLDAETLVEVRVELIAEEESGNKTITEEVLVRVDDDLVLPEEEEDDVEDAQENLPRAGAFPR